MTTKLSDSFATFKKQTLKRFLHLIVPFYLTLIVVYLVWIIAKPSLFLDGVWWRDAITRVICYDGPGTRHVCSIWFLYALFIGQSIFDLLHLVLKKDSYLLIACLTLTLIGVALGSAGIIMPFALDMALASMAFMFLGYWLKNHGFSKHSISRLLISLAVWAVCFFITYNDFTVDTYFEIFMRRYTYFPICFIGAAAGSIFVMQLCYFFCKIPHVYKPFAFLGRYTLYIVCIHTLDQFFWKKYFQIYPVAIYNHLITIAFFTGVFLIVLGIRLLITFLIKKSKEKTTSVA